MNLRRRYCLISSFFRARIQSGMTMSDIVHYIISISCKSYNSSYRDDTPSVVIPDWIRDLKIKHNNANLYPLNLLNALFLCGVR